MFKTMADNVWVFDVEWVPDPNAGRALYGQELPVAASDADSIALMWHKGGASPDNPMPYLKTVLCRVVSIAAVIRLVNHTEPKLFLLSLPRYPFAAAETEEAAIIGTFLNALGKKKPQLVGFNSQAADLKILVQRGMACGIQAPAFCQRPLKPWEGVDYFARGSEAHIDLLDIVGGWGKSTPSLHELAAVCQIPGKMGGMDGQQVAPLWLQGALDTIVAYNEFDALTTYLVWLRMAYFGGFLSPAQYADEQTRLRQLLQVEAARPERAHLHTYLREWDRLRQAQSVGLPGAGLAS